MRTEGAPFDLPASIDRLDGGRIREGRLQVNLSESLGSIPGIAVQNRQNYAQDLQVSVRGFGARTAFGVRGVRFYIDDIPATMPDGQGQTSNIDLASVGRIEVLRGPFSALYGNSSGGVVAVSTEDPGAHQGMQLAPSFALGDRETKRVALKVSGMSGERDTVGLVASASEFSTKGARDHSKAKRDLANAKATFKLSDSDTLAIVLNNVRLPKADDPLGLSRAQYASDPDSVDPGALQFNTRKTLSQTQGGAVYDRKLDGDNSVRLTAYTGSRATVQYQSIPVASQIPATSPGGVIDLSRRYSGFDTRWMRRTELGEQSVSFVAGINFDVLDEHRLGYQNFTGTGNAQQLGIKGALRRDEVNRIHDFDQYAQISWQIDPQWNISAGVRHSSVVFDSRDRYVVAGNPDDSGTLRYNATLPVFGLLYAMTDDLHWYVTAGRGFETPTGNELAYSPSGATGLNTALEPARSDNYEAGFKARLQSGLGVNAALFTAATRNEIVTLTNQGGRSTFTNAARTRRRGVELSAESRFADDGRASFAYTYLNAAYGSGFLSCVATPCAAPTISISAKSQMPGTARNLIGAALAWEPRLGWRTGLELRVSGRIFANDQNSEAAPGYAIVGAHVGYSVELTSWTLSGFARADNLFDRRYAGSVIVNEGNARYFEPAQGRNWLMGLNASLRL